MLLEYRPFCLSQLLASVAGTNHWRYSSNSSLFCFHSLAEIVFSLYKILLNAQQSGLNSHFQSKYIQSSANQLAQGYLCESCELNYCHRLCWSIRVVLDIDFNL